MATIQIFGRLTGDPEMRYTPTGNPATNFSLADNHGRDSQTGADKVSFFRCSVFGKAAELIATSCKKGHRLNVAGRFESREYTNNAGVKGLSLDVIVNEFNFVEPRDQAAPVAQQPQTAQPRPQYQQPQYQQPQYQQPAPGYQAPAPYPAPAPGAAQPPFQPTAAPGCPPAPAAFPPFSPQQPPTAAPQATMPTGRGAW